VIETSSAKIEMWTSGGSWYATLSIKKRNRRGQYSPLRDSRPHLVGSAERPVVGDACLSVLEKGKDPPDELLGDVFFVESVNEIFFPNAVISPGVIQKSHHRTEWFRLLEAVADALDCTEDGVFAASAWSKATLVVIEQVSAFRDVNEAIGDHTFENLDQAGREADWTEGADSRGWLALFEERDNHRVAPGLRNFAFTKGLIKNVEKDV